MDDKSTGAMEKSSDSGEYSLKGLGFFERLDLREPSPSSSFSSRFTSGSTSISVSSFLIFSLFLFTLSIVSPRRTFLFGSKEVKSTNRENRCSTTCDAQEGITTLPLERDSKKSPK